VPRLTLSDGVELHWEERGEGPLIVLAPQFFGYPEILEGLTADLARDHRVVSYHVRGTGGSTRAGPYDIETDAADLAALLEHLGEPAVLVPLGDGAARAVKAAGLCPEHLVRAIVAPGGNPIGRRASEGTDGLAASDTVIDALIGMMEVDYRSALNTMLDTANPDFTEEQLRHRIDRTVEHCPHEAALPRMRAWVTDDSTDEARALGDKLWLLEHGQNMWFPIEILKRTRELLPEAHVQQVENGPITRPDIAAEIVRGITSERPAGVSAREA
jgi:pimeloyl-ACP methyl ester carboxylesterase